MDALDLTQQPPRGPREKMLGLYFIPRTIDKIRAELSGGNPGDYFVEEPRGMSAFVLRKLGIDLAELRAVVACATNESEVADWLQTHANLADVPGLNARVSAVTVGMVDPETRALIDRFYTGAGGAPGDLKIFDLLEHDDAAAFA